MCNVMDDKDLDFEGMVPVKGYTALEAEKKRISLNQLHEECHSRIRYKKTCPIHGEVTNDEIVMRYEYRLAKTAIFQQARWFIDAFQAL